ncbi:MAG: glycosyl transferase family 2 [Chitinophagaceae bacterium]|nr:glycosyl transferase family 2 [Chitinophagaceae bacterium]
MSKLVSIIIPAYNAEKYIKDSVKSVLNQSWKNIEVIIVDDGSTDNTAQVVKNFTHDSRIKYTKQENKGCSAAKNTGLNSAKGDFIQYLDADDILTADKIEEQVNAIKDDDFSIAVCRTVTFSTNPVYKKSNEIDTEYIQFQGTPINFLLNLYGIKEKDGMIQPNAFLISRQLADKIGPWDVSLSPSTDEDSEYYCRAILASSKVIYTPNSINFYRSNPNIISLSRRKNINHVIGAFKTLDKKAEHLISFENSKRVKKVIAYTYSLFIYVYFEDYPDMAREAEERIYKLGFKKIPPAGGYRFKQLARIIQMKNALKARRFIRQKLHK